MIRKGHDENLIFCETNKQNRTKTMRTRIQKILDALLTVGLLGAFPQYGQSQTTPTSSNATNAGAASSERRPIEPLTDGIESTNWIVSCKQGNWREIMRHPDDNVGKPFWIKGNIQQLMEPSPGGNHIGNILVYEEGDTLRERQWLFAYDDERTTLPSGNLLKDDTIVVFAVFRRVAEIEMENPARLFGPKEWKEKMPLLHARLVTWETPEEFFKRYHSDNQRAAANPVQTVPSQPSPKKPTPKKPPQTTKQAIDKQNTPKKFDGNEKIRVIFSRAKHAEEKYDKLNLCGFYTGMSASDAETLAGHYALKTEEWSVAGDPVYKISFTLKGIRRVTKGGNTFSELMQAVENCVGDLKKDWDSKEYQLKTIDGITVTMSESQGFKMFDESEYKAAQQREMEKEFEEKTKTAISELIDSMVQIPGRDYKMGKYEVTQAQWVSVMGDNPSKFKGADNPVEEVSWNKCQEFLKKLNALPAVKKSRLVFRLPTEDEWRFACSGHAWKSIYCRLADGTEIGAFNLDRVAWFNEGLDGTTHPVGLKEPNAYGLYDMNGNVMEWTSTAEPGDEPHYVICGGSYWFEAKDCLYSQRSGQRASSYDCSWGFRLCSDSIAK